MGDFSCLPLDGDTKKAERKGLFASDADSFEATEALIIKEKGPDYESVYWDGKEYTAESYVSFFDKIVNILTPFGIKTAPERIVVSAYAQTQDKNPPLKRYEIKPQSLPLLEYLEDFLKYNTVLFVRIYGSDFSLCADTKKPEFRSHPQIGLVFEGGINDYFVEIIRDLYVNTAIKRVPSDLVAFQLRDAIKELCCQ